MPWRGNASRFARTLHVRPRKPPMLRPTLFFVFLAGILVACGSRGPIDDFDGPGGLDASAGNEDAGTHADATATDAADAHTPPSILDCGLCVTQKCGSKVARCVQDKACSKALTCVAQNCVLKGFDIACLTQCTGGDPQTALKAFEIAQCVTGVCGDSCTAGLPLGILGGGG